ncbi:MAG: hypothetical protein JJU00_19965 [Opitutales bacterium]|nr:hypothetical protein [Opitutales bacterium]
MNLEHINDGEEGGPVREKINKAFDAVATAAAYDLVLGFSGKPADAGTDKLVLARKCVFDPADAPVHFGTADVPAAAAAAFHLKAGETTLAEFDFQASADAPTIDTESLPESPVILAAGSEITLTAPGSADPDLEGIRITLRLKLTEEAE